MPLVVKCGYWFHKHKYGDTETTGEPISETSKVFARRSDSKDNSIITELDKVFLGGGGTSDESDIETF
jgi:hypothetical protein